MPRKFGVLVFAAFVLASSFVVEWAGTGGLAERLDLSDTRVIAASAYLRDPVPEGQSASYRTIVSAWVRDTSNGNQVSVGYKTGTGYWLTTVEFDSQGTFISNRTQMWSGIRMPGYLRLLSYIFFALWPIVAYVAPHLFAVKCPDCPSSFTNPALTKVEESMIYAGGVDVEGHILSPIVRRDYVCPTCGWRKITFYSEPRHTEGWRARPIGIATPVGMDLNPKELDWYEKVLGRYLSEHQGGKDLRFPTYEDWRAFFQELKNSEREERTGHNPA